MRREGGTGYLDVRVALTDQEREAHHRVRHAVFVEEQGIFAEHDRDCWDPTAIHVLATINEIPVGAVRLYPLDEAGLWKGDRLAVLRGLAACGSARPWCASRSRPPASGAARG